MSGHSRQGIESPPARRRLAVLALIITFLLVTPVSAASFYYDLGSSGPSQSKSEEQRVLSKLKGMSSTALLDFVGLPEVFYSLVIGSAEAVQQASAYLALGTPITIEEDLAVAPGVGDASALVLAAGIEEIQTVWVKPHPDVPSISALAADPANVVPETDSFVVRELLGVNRVFAEFGLDGTGVTVAVVDTGVDYSNPDLIDALLYVDLPNGGREPLVLDADESQVLLLQSFTPIAESIPTAGVRFRTITASPFTQSTIAADYVVGRIPTLSGVYRFGITQQAFYRAGASSGVPASFSRVGVLLYDPDTSGDYTYARVDLNNNKDFTDDQEIDYFGDRVSRLDTDGNGYPERTAGILGGFFQDIFFRFGRVGRYLPGWDRNGTYLSIFYDNNGHGTAVAGHVASRGSLSYDLPAFGPRTLPGIASGAKVLGVKALTVGNVEGGMLFAAGFDVDPAGDIFYMGSRRADIISNSWGISRAHYDQFGFGYDFESMFENGLTLPGFLDPNYPGIVIVQSAGNGNFGYGTVTSPGAASFVISVGASTSLYTTANLFGFSPEGKVDDVAHFSARGPTPLGEVKPDVVNVGAFAWDVGRIFEGTPQGTTIFSGTSEATPLTSGVVALMLQAANKEITDPFLIRSLLQSTSKDLGYNPFVQGNGRVDAYPAVLAAKRFNGENQTGPLTYLVSTPSSTAHLVQMLAESWRLQWGSAIPGSTFFSLGIRPPLLQLHLPQMRQALGSHPSGSLYLGHVRPGEKSTFELKVTELNGFDATITARGLNYAKMGQVVIRDEVSVPTSNDDKGGPSGPLEGQRFIILPPSMFVASPLTHFNLITDFSHFDLNFNYVREFRQRLWVFEWIDDGDGNIEDVELRQFNYGFPTGTSIQVTVADLLGRLSSPQSNIVVRVDLNRMTSAIPPVTIPFTLTITKYARATDETLSLTSLSGLPPMGETTLMGTLTVQPGHASGVYERMVEVAITSSMGSTVRVIPVSFNVLGSISSELTLTPPNSNEAVLYDLGAVRGSFDWIGGYESGDWRVYTVEVNEPKAFAVEVSFTWTYANTTIDIFVLGPDGQFAGVAPGSGTPFSQNRGFGVFRWHSVVDTSNRPLNKSVNLAQTRYSLGQFAQKGHSQVFTIYIHEVLHAGKTLSETITGTARILTTNQRLPGGFLLATPSVPKSIATSITLPYALSPSRGSPEPADMLSLSILAFGTAGVRFSPASRLNLFNVFAPDTMVTTRLVDLKATATDQGEYVVGVALLTTIPELRVFIRHGGLYGEFLVRAFGLTVFASPIYIFQDWTVLSVRGSAPKQGSSALAA